MYLISQFCTIVSSIWKCFLKSAIHFIVICAFKVGNSLKIHHSFIVASTGILKFLDWKWYKWWIFQLCCIFFCRFFDIANSVCNRKSCRMCNSSWDLEQIKNMGSSSSGTDLWGSIRRRICWISNWISKYYLHKYNHCCWYKTTKLSLLPVSEFALDLKFQWKDPKPYYLFALSIFHLVLPFLVSLSGASPMKLNCKRIFSFNKNVPTE